MFSLHKQPVWKCTCGATVPKHGAQPSGSPTSHHGLHIHCPNCNKTIAAHIDPRNDDEIIFRKRAKMLL